MLDRIRDFIGGPRWIGKYFKDKGIVVFLYIMLFFVAYALVLGVRSYSTEYFDEESVTAVASCIVQGEKSSIAYDADKAVFSGTATKYVGDGFSVSFFPVEDNTNKLPPNQLVIEPSYVNIVFEERYAVIEFGGMAVSKINYSSINADSFSLTDVQRNDIDALYNFKLIIKAVLMSSNVFFNTYNMFSDIMGNIMIFFVTFILLYFFVSKRVNPGIEGNVRAKLCFYDCIIFLVFCLLAALFNLSWLTFVGMAFPFIYCNITFRHIVRVYIKK